MINVRKGETAGEGEREKSAFDEMINRVQVKRMIKSCQSKFLPLAMHEIAHRAHTSVSWAI